MRSNGTLQKRLKVLFPTFVGGPTVAMRLDPLESNSLMCP